MAEIWGFDEDGMRKLVAAYRESLRRISNLERRLAHYSTRRHEAVYLPGKKEHKLIHFNHAPAAYGGGTYRTGITGTAAETNGNTNPTNLLIFPKLWQKSFAINSSGELEEESGNGWFVNLGSLPLTTGWAMASKLPYQLPGYGEVWVINGDYMPSHYGAACFRWDTEDGSGSWTFEDGDKKLIRASAGLGLFNNNKQAWAFSLNEDIILTHVGRWEVTFGYKGRMAGDFPYQEHTTGAQSAGTAHTHTYRTPTGARVLFGIHKNFEPGNTTLGSNDHAEYEMENYHPGRDLGSAVQRWHSFEKTIYIPTDLTPWHGQHHTRLSLYCNVTMESYTGTLGGGDPTFILEGAWMTIRPAMGVADGVNVGNDDFIGAGANQYPGGYSNGSGTFQWWGGGDEPDELDEDGVVIP